MVKEPDILMLLKQLQGVLESQQQNLIVRDIVGLWALTEQCAEVCRLTDAKRDELADILSEPDHPYRQEILTIGRTCQRLQQQNHECLEQLAGFIDVLIAKPEMGTVYLPGKVSRIPSCRHFLLKI